jgi:hypothetical protein
MSVLIGVIVSSLMEQLSPEIYWRWNKKEIEQTNSEYDWAYD